MFVILDWVPNHTGWDHVWLQENPDFYTRDNEGSITDPLDENGESMGWNDVADLNYDNPEMRVRMQNDMIYWLQEHHVDGFRQDMALLVPQDFWQSTILAIRSVKSDVFMLAESEIHDHANKNSFHSIYSWSLHHILNDVAQGKKSAEAIDQWYLNERPKLKKGSYMHFTSNHDENSWSGSEIERMGEAHKAFAVLVYTLDGIPLMYSGQEEPLYKRLEFFEKDTIGFNSYRYAEFYAALHKLKHENPSLWNAEYGGSFERIMHDKHIFAFERKKENNKVTVILNLSKQVMKPRVDRIIEGTEIFTGKSFNFNMGDELILEPWSYVVVVSNQK
jgi:glycosidase